MRFYNYLNESKKEDNIRKFINNLMKQESVPLVKIIFSNKELSRGPAFYKTERVKGGKKNYPKYIKIGEWDAIKNHPGEWTEVLGHELAHHIINMKKSSLRHSKEFYKKAEEISNKLKRKFAEQKSNSREKERLKKKIDYWEANRDEIEADQKTIDKNFNFEKELRKMKEKYKDLQ